RTRSQLCGRPVDGAAPHARTILRAAAATPLIGACTMNPMAQRDPDTAYKRIWYVSYGSNMSSERLRCYIEGGRPPGGNVDHVGARDRTPPIDTAGVILPGRLYFAGESRTWGGGMAF